MFMRKGESVTSIANIGDCTHSLSSLPARGDILAFGTGTINQLHRTDTRPRNRDPKKKEAVKQDAVAMKNNG